MDESLSRNGNEYFFELVQDVLVGIFPWSSCSFREASSRIVKLVIFG
ncbi:hypothetical protein LINGRAHAP2_LOCUS24782, partial [Linum grandiflorum]